MIALERYPRSCLGETRKFLWYISPHQEATGQNEVDGVVKVTGCFYSRRKGETVCIAALFANTV